MINSKIGDYERRALNGELVLTKFLDLDEQRQLNQLDHHIFHINYEGGYQEAERKRAIITTDDESIEFNDYEIAIFHFTTNPKLPAIVHRHVLGTMMGLGVERNTFGDIVVVDNDIYIVMTNDIKKYFIDNLTMINHQPIKLIKTSEVGCKQLKEVTETINIPSMRLDAIIASGLRLSRNEATKLIEAGLVQINHQECLHSDHKVNVDDMLSIRKYGRLTVKEILNTTRKNRLMIKIYRQF